jgi:hypothetical protein
MLLALDVILIINENDTVTTDEICLATTTLGALDESDGADVLVLLPISRGFTPTRVAIRRPRQRAAGGERGSRRWPAVPAARSSRRHVVQGARRQAARVRADRHRRRGEEKVLAWAAGEEIGTSLGAPKSPAHASSGGRPRPAAGRLTPDAGVARARATARATADRRVWVEGSFGAREIASRFDLKAASRAGSSTQRA